MRPWRAFEGFTPSHMLQLLGHSAKEFIDDSCTQMAAAISYYVLFSLFPLMFLAVGITGLWLQDTSFEDDLIEFLQEYLPVDQEGETGIADVIRDRAGVSSGALGLFGVIGLGWAGSGMFAVLRRSLNRAWDLEGGRPFVRQKLVDFAMMGMLGTLFLASLITTGLLRAARAYAEDIPLLGEWAQEFGLGWEFAAFLVPVAVSWIAFFLLYWLVPSTHVRKREAVIGAVVASILFEAAKVGFAIYVENFGSYDLVYGSLGGVVVFLFWVFVSANILLLGAEFASEFPRVMGGEYDSPRKRIPTVESLTPWPIRMRKRAMRLVRSLLIGTPARSRRP